jgi:hypothetical protein
MATDASSSRGGPADGIGCLERFVRQFAQSQRRGFRFATTQYADFHGGARPHAAVRRASARNASGIAHAHRLFSAFLDQPGNRRFNSVTIRHKRYASVLTRL